mmetsp:Transcript_91557/g.267942  ORF Transcript_91557/g.267942 Transcript_91557/m.267942 type:complete len:326 (+) Transcript_91557:143-1120(+)
MSSTRRAPSWASRPLAASRSQRFTALARLPQRRRSTAVPACARGPEAAAPGPARQAVRSRRSASTASSPLRLTSESKIEAGLSAMESRSLPIGSTWTSSVTSPSSQCPVPRISRSTTAGAPVGRKRSAHLSSHGSASWPSVQSATASAPRKRRGQRAAASKDLQNARDASSAFFPAAHSTRSSSPLGTSAKRSAPPPSAPAGETQSACVKPVGDSNLGPSAAQTSFSRLRGRACTRALAPGPAAVSSSATASARAEQPALSSAKGSSRVAQRVRSGHRASSASRVRASEGPAAVQTRPGTREASESATGMAARSEGKSPSCCSRR